MTEQADDTSQELARRQVGPNEAAALGELATQDHLPEVRGQTEWGRTETGLQTELAVVQLGKKLNAGGDLIGYADSFETPVPEAGIAFGVTQTSHGSTGIIAKPLAGFRVEAAQIDPSTNLVSWLQPDEDGKVSVAFDRSNMSKLPVGESWRNIDLGNPGVRGGIVRVTGPDEEVKHFALGADFQGEPDSWQVTGGIIEVTPRETQALPGSQAQLPSAE